MCQLIWFFFLSFSFLICPSSLKIQMGLVSDSVNTCFCFPAQGTCVNIFQFRTHVYIFRFRTHMSLFLFCFPLSIYFIVCTGFSIYFHLVIYGNFRFHVSTYFHNRILGIQPAEGHLHVQCCY